MATVAISTCLDKDTYERAKRSGMKWNQLLKLGLSSLDKKEQLREFEELRENNIKLQKKVAQLAGRVLSLEGVEE